MSCGRKKISLEKQKAKKNLSINGKQVVGQEKFVFLFKKLKTNLKSEYF